MNNTPTLLAIALFVALIITIAIAHSLDSGSSLRELFHRLKRRIFPPSEVLSGYEQSELVDLIFKKTVAYQAEGNWPEMANVSTVLDFGGGCGLHYKQAASPDVRWAVVETPAMVERAKSLATDKLQFFTDISEAAKWLGPIDVIYSNGALQYAPDPEEKLKQLCGAKAKKMLWHRVLLGEPARETQSCFLSDNGPGSFPVKEKIVKYERTKIPERAFLEAHKGYRIVERGDDWFKFVAS